MSKRIKASRGRAGRRGPPGAKPIADIGVVGALSIGIGGIIGGGFFATFGLAVVGARGSIFLSFFLGGLLALLTAYSYVHLTLRLGLSNQAEPLGLSDGRSVGRSYQPALMFC